MKNRSFIKRNWKTPPLVAMKNRIPDKDDDYLGMVLWNCTAFPFNSKYGTLRQAMYFESMGKVGISVCIRCGNPYKHSSGSVWIDQMCEDCQPLLKIS